MIWRFFETDTPVLIQGITGKEGSRMANWLIGSGVNVIGGVTPGKGGQEVEGKPVWNTVMEAKQSVPALEVTSIVVPPARVPGAVMEALDAGMRYINVLTENIPVHDVLRLRQEAKARGASILGPSSVGYLQFPRFRMGYIGGREPFQVLKEGGVAVVSNSGGMTNEILMSLARMGIGIRCAFAVGGDRVPGISLRDAVEYCDQLSEVQSIFVFAEPGHSLLGALASGSFQVTKPITLFVPGDVLDTLPRGMPYGHTGTVLGEDDASVSATREAIRARGYVCVGSLTEALSSCAGLTRLAIS